MTERYSKKDVIHREKAHEPTDRKRHRAGGPGKSARKGHVDPDHSGNKPGQRQSGADANRGNTHPE